MPREIAFHGLYLPTVTVLFLVAALLAWALDRVLAAAGLYHVVWHPALLRLALFICLYCALALCVYR